MARKAKAAAKEPQERQVTVVKFSLDYHGEPLYSNYAEVSAAQHEFQILFALTPTKPNPEQMQQIKGGTLTLEAAVQILIPPTVVPSLIKALTTIKEQYETVHGPIKELGVQQ